jgi:asparagine synthase (glutamine-hydrolysing)
VQITVDIYGYCDGGEAGISAIFSTRGAAGLGNLQGEYVIVISTLADEPGTRAQTWIVSSANGAVNYFYTVHQSRFYHADTLAGIVDAAEMRWEWNWRTLADILLLEHSLEHDTLHPSIHRMPPASILHWDGDRIHMETRPWESLYPMKRATPDEAVEALNRETAKWLTDETVISMSGGFDSRVLLSSMLKLGHKPRAFLTVGSAGSTDVEVSRAIANRFGIPIEVVGLDPADYIRYGPEISRLTNGTLTAGNWHVFIYEAKATTNLSSAFILGTNGEFVRSYLADYGIVTAIGDTLAPSTAMRTFWSRRVKPWLSPSELAGCNADLAEEFSESGRQTRIERLCKLCTPPLSQGLDRFYLEQRVRNFMGNGLRLYSAHAAWRTPFLGREWTVLAWNLPRHWKRGNNWHRYALTRNEPALLDFPEEHVGTYVREKAPSFYWTRFRKRRPAVGYAKYPEWFADGPLAEHIRANAHQISEIIAPDTVLEILDQHRRDGSRERVLSLLLSLIYWCTYLKSRVVQPSAKDISRNRQAR